MSRWIYAVIASTMLCCSSAVNAASISGIVLFSTDDFGNPSGHITLEDGAEVEAHLWRTLIGPKWYGLFVWAGLPIESLATRPLNAPNLMVEIPLIDGENDFTIVGEPGPLTTGDDYDRFSINLYFDGVLDHPGISVLFPRHGSPNGDAPTVSRANFLVSLGVDKVFNVRPSAFYDDGLVRVSVQAVSFSLSDIDIASPLILAKSGREDFLGLLKVFVEPSAGGAPIAPIGPGPEGFGVQPGIGVPGAIPQPGGPIGAPMGLGGNPAVLDPGAPLPNQAVRGNAHPTPAIATGNAETEPTAEATANGTTTPVAGTLTPSAAARGTTSPTVATQKTLTPAGTPGAATATPHAAGTGSPTAAKPAATPTPHSRTLEKNN